MRWLRQSTAREVAVGPFLDSTDGSSVESALTITSSEVLLKKNEADWAAKNEATSLVHESNGWYRCLLDATDTNTLGVLMLGVTEAGALPVWHEFMVVTANVWDTWFSTDVLDTSVTQWLGAAVGAGTAGVPNVDVTRIANAAVSTGTAQLGVNVVNFGGSAGTFAAGRPEVNTTHAAGTAWGSGAITAGSIATGAITNVKFAAGAIDAAAVATDAIGASELAADAVTEIANGVWALDATGQQTQGSFGQAIGDPTTQTSILARLPNATPGAAGGLFIAGTNAATTVTTSFTTTFTGNVTGSVGSVTGLTASNLDATVSSRLASASYTAPPSAAANADAVWDEVMSGHLTVGTYGQRLSPIRTGTAQAGSGTSITLDASASATGQFYNGQLILITAGTGAGQARVIVDYNGTSKVADVFYTWAVNPDNTSEFVILPLDFRLNTSSISYAVWDYDVPGAHGAGKAAYNLDATVSSRATQTSVNTVDDFLDTEIADIQSRLPAALVSGRMDSSLSAAGLAADAVDEILDEVVEGSTTMRQALRLFLSALASKVSGAGTPTITFRDIGDSKNRIVATVDGDGNRSAITLDVT